MKDGRTEGRKAVLKDGRKVVKEGRKVERVGRKEG
jgi:hypothetical protein